MAIQSRLAHSALSGLQAVWIASLALAAPILSQTRGSQTSVRSDSARLAPFTSLVVRLTDPPREAHGAGIIVGESNGTLYVATARHVLEMIGGAYDPPRVVTSVRVAFFPDTGATVPGRVDARSYNDTNVTRYDIALLAISKADIQRYAKRFDLKKLDFNRRSDRSHVRSGDRVYSVGCPQGVCWEVPTDESVLNVGEHLTFLTQFVRPGNSGGALFTEWGEVAGMVLESKPPIGHAISTDALIERLRSWDASAVSLRSPTVPPWPYAFEIEAAALASQSRQSGRYPSGRATLHGSLAPVLSWHAGAMRLAPENLALTAAVAGLSIRSPRIGRTTAAVFVDAGLGRV
ncbi:MAG TPA: serine protease, partial [Gemmatimonadaceae bacterium]|nr:serine protease [Gemmatimonadaceae bacterium]